MGWPLLAGAAAEFAGLRARFGRRLAGAGSWRIGGALRICLHLCIAAILFYYCSDLVRPGFSEWVEAEVVRAGRNWCEGGAIYPAAPPPGRNATMPYGPLLFQIVGGVNCLACRSTTILKLLPGLLTGFAYSAMYSTLRQQGSARWLAVLIVELLAVSGGIMETMVKADVMLLLLAVLAARVAAQQRSARGTAIGLGVLSGLAMAIKLHGPLYILPAFVEAAAQRSAGQRSGLFAWAAVPFGVAAFSPFLLPGTNLHRYIAVLLQATGDGMLFGVFLSNAAFIGMFALCVHVLTPPAERDRFYRRNMIGVVIAGAGVCVAAAKAEAGPHHLIPLLPYLGLLLGRTLSGMPIEVPARNSAPHVLLLLFLIAFQPISGIVGDMAAMLRHWHSGAPLL